MRILLECAVVAVLAMLVSVMAPSQGTSQVPNGGFDSWTGGIPDGWLTSNVPTIVTPVTATTTRHGGALAARGEVLSAFTAIWPAYLWGMFPQTTAVGSLQFYYQFAPQGGDELEIGVVIYDGGMLMAVADTSVAVAAGTFTLMNLPMEAVQPGTPDSCWIWIGIVPGGSASDPTIGSSFIIDDVALVGSATSVPIDRSIPYSFELGQNYPNPFNPSTSIEYSLPDVSQVRLDVFNAIGERVATLVDARQDAGKYRARFDASALPSGVYLYRLNAGNSASVKRMILVK